MSFYIVIREMQHTDTPAVSQVVRNAYSSNIYDTWLNALFHEVHIKVSLLLCYLIYNNYR